MTTVVARRSVPGEPGVWVLVSSDLAVFTALFMTFAWYRGDSSAAFLADQRSLSATHGTLNTLFLLTGSLAVVLALRSARLGDWVRPRRFLLAAIVSGAAFVVSKLIEYAEMLSTVGTIHGNSFLMYYFVLTGLHLVHVLAGLGVLGFLSARAPRSRPYVEKELTFLEIGGIVWHLVDLLWIVLFSLLYVLP